MLLVLLLLSTFSLASADYECLCNYNVETPVVDEPSDSSTNIGTLYEFDCKPVVHAGEVDHKQWGTIAYEHQEGYVKLNSGTKIQTCPGNPAVNDLVTTKFPPTTTTTSTSSTAQMTETSSISTKPNMTITESSSSLTPRTSTTVSSTVEQTTTTRPTSTPHATTVSTTTPSTTSTTSAPLSTHELSTTTPLTSSSASTTASTTRTTTQPSTQQQTSPSSQPTSTSAQTSTMITTSTTSPPTTTKSSTTTTVVMTTSSTTQSSTTTSRTSTVKSTAFRPGQFTIGNTMLCPASIRQHASQKHGILAQYGGICYNIERYSVSWEHAENTCKYYGGHLLSINSAAENYFIYRLLDTKYNHTVWMGLHDRGHEEHFTWTSGIPVNYTNWYPYRKSNFNNHNDEDCAVFVPYLHHGQWDDIMCGFTDPFIEDIFETHPFICQYAAIASTQPATTTTTTTIRPLPYSPGNIKLCPANRRILGITSHLAQYGNSCYEWFTGRASWRHAESNCVTHGGHLVQIKDTKEESFIQQFMNSHDSQHAIWIGLYDLGHEETFKWTSGDPVSYTNWIPGRKSNFVSHNSEDCVAFIPYKQGQWDDIPCGSSGGLFGDSGETHPYMCEYEIKSSTSNILGGLIG